MKARPIRYCTGGCSKGEHDAHFYRVDPIDGPLETECLCPGNKGQAMEIMERSDSGELVGTLHGYITERGDA